MDKEIEAKILGVEREYLKKLHECVRIIAEKLEEKHFGEAHHFRVGEITVNKWRGARDTSMVYAACDILAAMNWLRRIELKPTKKGGRPGVRYEINPKFMEKPQRTGVKDEFFIIVPASALV